MNPILFSFNIRRSVYETYGLFFFKHIPSLISTPIILVPIISDTNDDIHSRALSLKRRVEKLSLFHKFNKCNLIGYSLSGIDARYAITKLGLNAQCESLTTIASPHQGSWAAELAESKAITPENSESVARLLGVGMRGFYQVSPSFMYEFNKNVHNAANVKYFSIGAERLPNNCHPSLTSLGTYLRYNRHLNFPYENDGIFGHDEIVWGEHLVNFEADHSEIVGINSYPFVADVFNLITERIKDPHPAVHPLPEALLSETNLNKPVKYVENPLSPEEWASLVGEAKNHENKETDETLEKFDISFDHEDIRNKTGKKEKIKADSIIGQYVKTKSKTGLNAHESNDIDFKSSLNEDDFLPQEHKYLWQIEKEKIKERKKRSDL